MIDSKLYHQYTFTVIIPYYNSHASIERAVHSVLNQTSEVQEIIVVDDASTSVATDSALSNVQSLSNLVRIMRYKHNRGPAYARNLGWNAATTEWVAFLDSDDYWLPSKIEVFRSVLANNSRTMLISDVSKVSESVNPLSVKITLDHSCLVRPQVIWHSIFSNPFATPCVSLRCNCQLRFDEKLRYCEDYDLWLRLIHHYPGRCLLISPCLTRLGHVPASRSVGLSSRLRLMEYSELIVLCRAAARYPLLFVIIPFALVFSLMKYLIRVLKRYSTPD